MPSALPHDIDLLLGETLPEVARELKTVRHEALDTEGGVRHRVERLASAGLLPVDHHEVVLERCHVSI
jgi:hypothetical protein